MGGVNESRGWEAWMEGVHGRRTWKTCMGDVNGRRVWKASMGGVWTLGSAVYQSVKLASPDPVRAAAPSGLMSQHVPLVGV
ncbi:hypothetical protein E2C01_043830 [Portunus trituberculatus]|uniref:Uncharacterized protein n=1 Tax=Portunus trituberculatus TaxID=210409 RepID=A0A5B7FRA9_PORTR|nr:hypothetical protein [Portunus trituberculatus]